MMSVVRGINMTTLGHEVGYRYFLTGKSPQGGAARGSSTATEIVGQMKPAVPIPSIAYNIETYNDRYPGTANALRVSRTDDLLLTLDAEQPALDSEIEKSLVDFRGQPITCEAAAYGARGRGHHLPDSRDQMRAVLSAKLDSPWTCSAARAARSRRRRAPSTTCAARNGRATTSPAGRAAHGGHGAEEGHQPVRVHQPDGRPGHALRHAARRMPASSASGFNALARMVDDLRATPHPAGGNFMDHTTILVFSEFARTPLINATGGRDHHLSSSCALMGAGLKHNFVFGTSGDIGMAPGTVDLRTGQPSLNGREHPARAHHRHGAGLGEPGLQLSRAWSPCGACWPEALMSTAPRPR